MPPPLHELGLWPPHLRVYGHPRSGNHFLASLLWRAFYGASDAYGGDVSPTATGHWSRRVDAPPGARAKDTFFHFDGERHGGPDEDLVRVPYARLLGSHRLPPPPDVGTPRALGVYVFRDGRDVALSVHAWRRFHPIGCEDLPIEAYLARPIDWSGSPAHRAAVAQETLFGHWMRHLRTWRATGILCVRYEDLLRDPARQLARIADRFDLEVGDDLYRDLTPENPVGWQATAADKPGDRVAKWKDALPPRALAMYDALVPRNFFGRFDP